MNFLLHYIAEGDLEPLIDPLIKSIAKDFSIEQQNMFVSSSLANLLWLTDCFKHIIHLSKCEAYVRQTSGKSAKLCWQIHL